MDKEKLSQGIVGLLVYGVFFLANVSIDKG